MLSQLSPGDMQCVNICDCTADPSLGDGRRRLCRRATDDHDEFRLLQVMNSRFIADSRSGGEAIATKACQKEVDVFFILDPDSSTVVGYAAMVPDFDHGIIPATGDSCPYDDEIARRVASAATGPLPLLSQLFVEQNARRQGLATATLRVLLAGRTAVAVESPSLATAKAMLRLGFKPVGAHLSGSRRRVVYARVHVLASGAQADENN